MGLSLRMDMGLSSGVLGKPPTPPAPPPGTTGQPIGLLLALTYAS